MALHKAITLVYMGDSQANFRYKRVIKANYSRNFNSENISKIFKKNKGNFCILFCERGD